MKLVILTLVAIFVAFSESKDKGQGGGSADNVIDAVKYFGVSEKEFNSCAQDDKSMANTADKLTAYSNAYAKNQLGGDKLKTSVREILKASLFCKSEADIDAKLKTYMEDHQEKKENGNKQKEEGKEKKGSD
ncbi:uncharacterized protein LOC117175225 [Belonocnema kinseyi]|uniref:uncharacterized protein LOC117175225 n=1 Tax=Belonocnema kinseyi TaxID=2817044 RepID=UPI00143D8244|nr:uncharacterized protein LOC117175225 [Belonocnema kinseyi]